jgi:hypothetical protein
MKGIDYREKLTKIVVLLLAWWGRKMKQNYVP